MVLLSLIAFFAVTSAADPCSGDSDCGAGPCHLLCVDGCTTTPVPAFHEAAAPGLSFHDAVPALKPLPPTAPDLDTAHRPPRTLA